MPTEPASQPPAAALPRLAAALRDIGLAAHSAGNALVFARNGMTTRVSFIPPWREADGTATPASLTLETRLPDRLAALILAPEIVDAMNQHAALGALVAENGEYIVGARLSIRDGEPAAELAHRLVLHASVAALDAMLKEPDAAPMAEPSAWARADLVAAADVLAMFSPARESWPRLAAGFALKQAPLKQAHHGPAAPDAPVATWTLDASRPHPALGTGLMCRLHLPHTVAHRTRLLGVLNRLNAMELQPLDLPPFLGAWCTGPDGHTPAHVMFLPNALAACPGIATTVSVWAYMRAQWAHAMLAALGIHAPPVAARAPTC